MRRFSYIFGLLFIFAILFGIIDWNVDGFEFLKTQNYKMYFQSWISFAGSTFVFVMSITTFIVYKKSDILSLKFVSIGFLFIAIAYGIIAYHTSYCKMCSDLSLCGASHSYPNYSVIIAMIIFVLTSLLIQTKFKLSLIKTFSFGLIIATISLMIIIFISVGYIETPDIIPYVLSIINLQGFIFVFPLLFTLMVYIYFKNTYNVTPVISFIFILIFLSFIPQAYHIFSCTECHNMECSEFYILSGLFIFMAIGSLFYAINLQLKNRN